ncbi:MAG: hypothetical protein E4H14_16300 [Candidatus Thorarchaeota archaeon]|nr:MAG: hypothetical protein E4H14_16300 [Candidatus Thorarchaeota archaeon]
MTLIFQSIPFTLYVIAVWIYVLIATVLLTPKGKLYFEQRVKDPVAINAKNAQLISLTVCGSGSVMIVLLLAPFFITVLGIPDWIDFVVAFLVATIIEVYAYSRKSHEYISSNK